MDGCCALFNFHLWGFLFVLFFWFGLSFISSISIREENEGPVARGRDQPQVWGRCMSVTSHPAQVTFFFPLFLQSLLGLGMKASEVQRDQPSCLCPFMTYQRKNSSQNSFRMSGRALGQEEGLPNLPKSLISVRCEKLRCLFQRSPAPRLRETEPEEIGADRPRSGPAFSGFPMALSLLIHLRLPTWLSEVISPQFPWAEVLQQPTAFVILSHLIDCLSFPHVPLPLDCYLLLTSARSREEAGLSLQALCFPSSLQGRDVCDASCVPLDRIENHLRDKCSQ